MMGLNVGSIAETGETQKLEMVDIRILNDIHRGIGEVMSGQRCYGRLPRYVFLGRSEYTRLIESTFLIFSHELANELGKYEMADFVMGVEIVRVDRDNFLSVI